MAVTLLRSPYLVRDKPHLSDVDESTHQVLVAECRDGILGLLPGSIFHNSAGRSSQRSCPARSEKEVCALTRIPTNTHGQCPNPSIQPFHQGCKSNTETQGKESHKGTSRNCV